MKKLRKKEKIEMPDNQNVNTLMDVKTGQPIPLAMQQMDVTGRVTPAGALLRVTHHFKCGGDKPMEALYVFKTPRNGTLRRFIVKGADFEVESKLNPREEARKEYEEGVEAGHLSVLAETSLDGMVTLSIGQVKPGEEVSILLDMVVGVELQDSKFRFRFPFTMAPCYHAKAKSYATSEGGKIELPSDVFGDLILPEWKTKADGLHEVSFNLIVEAIGEISSITSPSHKVAVTLNPDNSAEVSLASDADIPNRDLVLDVLPKQMAPVVLADDFATLPNLPKNAPHWSIVVPSTVFPAVTKTTRRVCFLMDASGSMDGQRINQAKMAFVACLTALEDTDEFGLLAFGSTVERFKTGMLRATDENRRASAAWLRDLRSLGGTEMEAAIDAAIQVIGAEEGDIFLLTDGEVYQTSSIIEKCASRGIRIHVLGIGASAEDRFLESLARKTGGVSEMVNTDEDVANKTLNLLNAIKHPVATDVKVYVELEGGKKQEHHLGTVYQDRPVIITDHGKCGKHVPVSVKFVCGSGQTFETQPTAKKFVPEGLVALLWAGRQIEDLESRLDYEDSESEKETIRKDLKAVSTSYSLASRVMSLVAVISRIGDVSGEMEQKVVPVGLPSDMEASGVFSIQGNVLTRGMNVNNVAMACLSFADTSNVGCYSATPSVTSGGSHSRAWASIKQTSTRCVSHLVGCSADSYSPELSTDFLQLPVNGRIMAELAKMNSDGGVAGEPRVLLTLLLGMALVDEAIETNNNAYSMHLKKIAKFLDKSAVADPLWGDILKKAAERMRDCTVQSKGGISFMYEFDRLRVRPTYTDQIPDLLDAFKSEFDI